MDFDIITILVIVLAALSILDLGLGAYVADFYLTPVDSQVSFMIFTSVWSLLVLAYIAFVPKFLKQAYHSLAPLGLSVVTTIFWFAGSIATAVLLGTPDGCSSNNQCRSFQAFIAFGFFLWVGFTALSVLFGLEYKKNSGAGLRPSTNTHAPAAHPYPSV